MAEERHLFPGNNTPGGFYSYYKYILGQKEADKIICIKGGPGVGKSTFMRKIGAEFLKRGENVDFMHCSSDDSSLDGVVLKDRRVAFIDATAPHVVDPVNPGAVDTIIHLGDYWDEAGLRKNKLEMLAVNEKIKRWFSYAYSYLGAAGKMYEALSSVYDMAVENAEIYKMAAHLIGDELGHREICLKPGKSKRYFASAITPAGFKNHIMSLIEGYENVYFINAPVGIGGERLLGIFAESATYRGLQTEQYYCPMKPETKLEHLLVPDIGTAFVTTNNYHDVEPWQLSEFVGGEKRKIVLLDINEYIEERRLEEMRPFITDTQDKMDELLVYAVRCLANAKKYHDELEKYYIPNMNFEGIDELRKKLVDEIG